LDAVEEGKLVGEVVDARSSEVIEDVKVNVLDSPLETTTNSDGAFSFDSIYEGNYELVLEIGGYVTETVTATVSADETVEIAVEMDPIDVAVLNDYEETITTLLNRNNIPAEEREWDDILSDMDKYQVVYLNGAYKSGGWQPDQEDVNALLETAEAEDVSVVFTDAWGINYGSIQHLQEFYNDPTTIQHDSGNSTISLKIEEEHPIFGDKKVGDKVDVVKDGMPSWFSGYSGRNLATLGSHRLGDVGTASLINLYQKTVLIYYSRHMGQHHGTYLRPIG